MQLHEILASYQIILLVFFILRLIKLSFSISQKLWNSITWNTSINLIQVCIAHIGHTSVFVVLSHRSDKLSS